MLQIGQSVRLVIDYEGIPENSVGMVYSVDKSLLEGSRYTIEWQQPGKTTQSLFEEWEADMFLETVDD